MLVWLFSSGQPAIDYAQNPALWKQRVAAIRQAILDGAELSPLPVKVPLQPVVTHVRRRSGYTVSDVALRAAPGLIVFGNLYVPSALKGKAPAILVTHGHFRSAVWYPRTRPENQILCARLAQMGAVVFTYDMVGWGDATTIDHNVPNVLQLQLWDSIRALDFVEQLPFVDSRRIGVTGASGGATQAIYLAAVDDRIAASMPVVMVSSHYTGHERCEDGMPVHKVSGEPASNNVEIAAAIAPKPLMTISDNIDWTRDFPSQDLPLLLRIYHLFPGAHIPENVHMPREKHDYGPNKRYWAYRFFSQSFGLKLLPNTSARAASFRGKGQSGPDFDPNPEGVTIENPVDQAVRPWIRIDDDPGKVTDHAAAALLRSQCAPCTEAGTPVRPKDGEPAPGILEFSPADLARK